MYTSMKHMYHVHHVHINHVHHVHIKHTNISIIYIYIDIHEVLKLDTRLTTCGADDFHNVVVPMIVATKMNRFNYQYI